INRGLDNTFYWGLGAMALLILLTACLNFTNTTISFSNKRLKEMGVRKVMGGGRSQIMFQLLGECLVICSLAAGFAIITAEYLMPLFNQMWESANIELALNYTDSPDLLLFIGGTILLVTLFAGAYPAFYISSFKPSQIFRGSTKFGGDNLLIRSLLGLQIIVSLISIIGGITFAQNSEFQKNFDLGYDTEGIINVNIRGEKDYNNFKQLITQNPDILGVAGARNNLGFGNWWNSLGKKEDNRWVQVQLVGEHFFEVMGLDIMEGRPFDKELATDYESSVVVNQKFLKDQQWESGLGQQIEMYNKTFNIVGVVNDFYQESFMGKPSPNVFHFKKPDQYRILKVKVANDKIIAMNKYLENTWKANFPLLPFSSYYQDEAVAENLGISENVALLNLFLAIVSILLAAIGLYSLVSLNVLKRAKEIAVRRVLGASAENITYTINKHYVIVFAVGGILGGLAGGWFTGFLLEQIFQVNQGVNTLSVILAIVGVCIVGALTIGGKLYTVLQTNPAETLKSE
ncbi:MAG: FtsX-like permease family protein, partial [Saprospiraceae bacterium]